jgi:predicted CoA-binding protein
MNTSENKKTVVIGASPNPERYGYKATEKLVNQGIETIPLGVKPGIIGKSVIINDRPAEKGVHTVTLYLNPKNQEECYDYILSLHPKRIIFNPGTENPAFALLANHQGITTTDACTLVLLATNQY